MESLACFAEGISRLAAVVTPSPHIERYEAVSGGNGLAVFGATFAALARIGTVARSWQMEVL